MPAASCACRLEWSWWDVRGREGRAWPWPSWVPGGRRVGGPPADREGLWGHLASRGVETCLRSRPIIDELTGHEGTGETSRYAKGASLKVLAEAVCRLNYGFDTAHLTRPE